MAFMNQEKKTVISNALKAVIPADWKWSLRVHHHSTITLTIRSAPIDLVAAYNAKDRNSTSRFQPSTGYMQLNTHHLENAFEGELLALFEKINTALNTGNHDRSDIQSDYFDVGFYAYLHIGEWNKAFTVSEAAKVEA